MASLGYCVGKMDKEICKTVKEQESRGLKRWGCAEWRSTEWEHMQSYRYEGSYFHQNVAVVVPFEQSALPAVWCFLKDNSFGEVVRRIDQTLKVTNATLTKVPFVLDRWAGVARERYPNGLPLLLR